MKLFRTSLFVLGVAFVAACSGGGGGGDDVASLDEDRAEAVEDEAAGAAGAATDAEAEAEREDSLLAYADCMRENGVDLPALERNDRGEAILPLRDESYADEDFPDADETCSPLLGSIIAPDITPAEQARRHDRALANVRCMREHGINLPDPDPRAAGFTVLEDDGRPIDLDDPDFVAANEACADAQPAEPPGG
jgi:hypothetical protein